MPQCCLQEEVLCEDSKRRGHVQVGCGHPSTPLLAVGFKGLHVLPVKIMPNDGLRKAKPCYRKPCRTQSTQKSEQDCSVEVVSSVPQVWATKEGTP